MAPPLILSLAQCTAPSLVGGKATGLARLVAAGLPVPDGCCITTEAYKRFLARIGCSPAEQWRRAVEGTRDARREELRRCREMIRRSDPGDLFRMLEQELQRVVGADRRRWALRSSATNEDLAHASAAGLYRTVLGVLPRDIASGMREIWASVWEERVIEYMLRVGSANEPPAMAVVVQPLLQATIAGVATSIDPIRRRAEEVTINAVRGLGQTLVEGKVSPNQYVVDVQLGRVITRIPGNQQERLVVTHEGVAIQPISLVEQEQPLMADSALLEVARVVKRIEQVFERPVDVEWAIEGERVWMLQARPVTAIGTPSQIQNEDCEWSRANFKETMPELPSPMGLSFLERFMDIYIISHYRRLGCRIPPGLSAVRIFAGRPYLNVTLFHILVAQLGGDPTLNAEQMGGDPVRVSPPAEPLSWRSQLRAGWLMWREMRRVMNDGPASFADMKALASRYGRQLVRTLSLADAQQALEDLGRWLDSREVTFGIAAGAGQCLQVFSRILPAWIGSDWRRLLNESLQGQGTVISAQQILSIAELVRVAREEAEVCQAFRRGWERGHYRRTFAQTQFLSAFDRYLEEYGHRAVGESDLMSLRLADQPEALLDVIKNQLDGPPAIPEDILRRQRTARDEALATLRARCGWRLHRWLIFQWWYRRLCRFFALREANRHHLMWYGLAARNLLLHFGELLRGQGQLRCADDVFFLTLQELEAVDDVSMRGWQEIVDARRAERERWSGVQVPDVIRRGEGDEQPFHASSTIGDGELRGLPVSSGIVTGAVRLVHTPTDWNRVRSGDIIVAPVIDPGMAPLFGIAGGLIAEMGGTLSHGAIIAREFGLPTITNVFRATSLLSENDHVTVDGVQGVVRRVSSVTGP